jgi:hypothetical protein
MKMPAISPYKTIKAGAVEETASLRCKRMVDPSSRLVNSSRDNINHFSLMCRSLVDAECELGMVDNTSIVGC